MIFHPWGTSHLIAISVIGIIGFLIFHWGNIIPRRFLAVLLLLLNFPYQVYGMLPPNFTIEQSIPLHICDLAWVVGFFSLWSQNAWAQRLFYYWGLTLTSQALLTPALILDFPSLMYFGFWIDHGVVFLCALYLAAVLKYRPGVSDFYHAFGFTVIYGFFVLGFNLRFGTNYMFLNQKPPHSALDLMGPWPYYLLVESFIVGGIWYLFFTKKSKERP